MARKTAEAPKVEPTEEQKAEMQQAYADVCATEFDELVTKAVAETEAVSELARSLGWKLGDLAETMRSVQYYGEYVMMARAHGAKISSTYANEKDPHSSPPADDADADLRAFYAMLTMMKKASGHVGKIEAARNALNSLDRSF